MNLATQRFLRIFSDLRISVFRMETLNKSSAAQSSGCALPVALRMVGSISCAGIGTMEARNAH